VASLLIQHMIYGKLVTSEGGSILPGFEHAVIGRTLNLKGMIPQILPATFNGFAFSPTHMISPDKGLYILRPFSFDPDATPASTNPAFSSKNSLPWNGMVMTFARFRSERGENRPGRLYLQAETWLLDSNNWERYAHIFLHHAAEHMRADPLLASVPVEERVQLPYIEILLGLNYSMPVSKHAESIYRFLGSKSNGGPHCSFSGDEFGAQPEFLHALADGLEMFSNNGQKIPPIAALSGVPINEAERFLRAKNYDITYHPSKPQIPVAAPTKFVADYEQPVAVVIEPFAARETTSPNALDLVGLPPEIAALLTATSRQGFDRDSIDNMFRQAARGDPSRRAVLKRF